MTNLLFLGSAGAILLGTLWPTFTEAVRHVSATLTAENYNRFMGPLGLLLVLLLGLCPLIEWRKISAGRLLRNVWIQVAVGVVTAALLLLFGVREVWVAAAFAVVAFAAATIVLQWAAGIVARMRTAKENLLVATGQAIRRNRRRYGAQIIHLAILLIVAGVIGSQAYQDEVQVVLAKGEQTEVGGYTLVYKSYTYGQQEENGNKVRNAALVEVYRNGRLLATMEPERNLHSNVDGSVTEVALRSNLKEDLYLVLASIESDGLAAFQVIITPMVIWLWIGGVLLILGTLVAAWPAASRPATVTVPAGQRAPASRQRGGNGHRGRSDLLSIGFARRRGDRLPSAAGPRADCAGAGRHRRRDRSSGPQAAPGQGRGRARLPCLRRRPTNRVTASASAAAGRCRRATRSNRQLPPTGPLCPSCGATLQEGDKFCAKCGYTLHDEEVA